MINENPFVWIGILCVLIIYFYGDYKIRQWQHENDVSYISAAETKILQAGLTSNTVMRMGVYDTQADCEQKCKEIPWCNGYSWFNKSNLANANKCYGVNYIAARVPQYGVNSAYMPRINTGKLGKPVIRPPMKPQDFI